MGLEFVKASILIFTKINHMSLLGNSNKKGGKKQGGANKSAAPGGNSKFMKSNSKTQAPPKKVRSTGANRGS
jgi:hypothetical protein